MIVESFITSKPEKNQFIVDTRSQDSPLPNQLPKDLEAFYTKQLLQAKKENALDEQIFYLEKISCLYLEKNDWKKGAQILNAAIAFVEKQCQNLNTLNDLLAKAEQIEILFLKSRGFVSKSHNSISHNRTQLRTSRKECIDKFNRKEPITKVLFCLTESFKKLLGSLIEDCMKVLGTPPTKWSCAGMGSMARNEMCPYSDVEFIFLIEKKNEENLKYFRLLSEFLELKIINLGETEFPVFGERDESPTPKGFSMDTGGNSPLGKPGVFELIDTPQGMAGYLSEKWMQDDIILPSVLSSVCHVAGEKKLTDGYCAARDKQLNLTDGFFSFTGVPFREKLAIELLKGHLKEFKPNLSKEKEEIQAFGIKNELYRPFQSILGSVALFGGIEAHSSFAMIDQLLGATEGAKNLQTALQQVLSLRFEAHAFYQREKEILLQLEVGKLQPSNFLYLDKTHLKTLQEVYKVLIPFHLCGEKFLKGQSLSIFKDKTFYGQAPSQEGSKHHKAFEYIKAQGALQNAVSLDPNDLEALLRLGNIEREMGKGQEALPRCLKAVEVAKSNYGPEHPLVAKSLNDLGVVYSSLGNFSKVLECYEEALPIWLKSKNENVVDLATCYSNLSYLHRRLENYEKALENAYQGLDIRLKELGELHPHVAISYCGLSETYMLLDNYEKALIYGEKGLKVRMSVLKKNDPRLAESYRNMGRLHYFLGNYSEAKNNYTQVSKITTEIFGENHSHMAVCYNDVGLAHYKLEEHKQAIQYYEKALVVWVQDKNTSNIAVTYNNLGKAYCGLKKHEIAIEFHEKAKALYSTSLKPNHPYFSLNLSNIGEVHQSSGHYQEALKCHQEALDMRLPILGEHHMDVGRSYYNMGLAHEALENQTNAFDSYLKAIKIFFSAKLLHPDGINVLRRFVFFCKKLVHIEPEVIGEIYYLCEKKLGFDHVLIKEHLKSVSLREKIAHGEF